MDSNYLNNTVFCKLAPSPIHGIGVFAIRDIPKGQRLSDKDLNSTLYEMTEGEFYEILPEIRDLIRQRTLFRKDRNLIFYSPNHHQAYQAFMNHTDDPNSDGHFAIKDIKEGEEITENYFSIVGDPHELTKGILNI